MGSIRQRGDAYEARVRIKPHPTKSRSFDTIEEAERWVRREEARLLLADAPVAAGPAFSVWIEKYIKEVADRWTTAQDKKARLRGVLADQIARIPVGELTPDDFEQLGARLAVGRKPQTVRHYLQDCSAVWEAARKRWKATKLANPLRDVEMPPVAPGRRTRLPADTWAKIRAHLASHVNPFYAPFADFLLETAMRVAEPLGVRHQDVDYETSVLSVVGKGALQRVVPLTPRALQVIRDVVKLRNELPVVGQAPNGGRYDLEAYDADLIWPISYRGFARAWRDARGAAGADHIWIHDIRRERATRLLEEGYDLASVAAVTGHHSLETLRKHYAVVEAATLAKRLALSPPAAGAVPASPRVEPSAAGPAPARAPSPER